MKHLILVIMLAVGALSVNAQGAKVTINELSAKVEVTMNVDKALKTAVTSGIVARQDSELTVINITGGLNHKTVFVVEYINSRYHLYELGTFVDDKGNSNEEVIETFESTRVADVRAMILQWLDF